MLEIEDLNSRMNRTDNIYKKSEAEIKIKILTGLPEEYSKVTALEKQHILTRSLK